MTTQRVKIVAATIIALIGAALAWRALAPVVAPYDASPRVSDSASEADAASDARLGLLPESIGDAVSPETAPERARALVDRAFAGADLSEITRDERRLLRAAASDWIAPYLSGSFDAYLEMLRSTGANSDLLDPDLNEQTREGRRRVWRSTGSVVAGRAVSVADAMMRPRFIRGRAIEQPDLGDITSATAARRYGLSDDPEAAGLTIYEIVFPVRYEFESANTRGPAWFGVWFARDRETTSGWVPYKTVIYDPAGIDAAVVPTF